MFKALAKLTVKLLVAVIISPFLVLGVISAFVFLGLYIGFMWTNKFFKYYLGV